LAELKLGSSRKRAPVPAHVGHFYSGPDDVADQVAFASSAIADPARALLLFGPRGVAEVLLRELESHVGRQLATERRKGQIVLAHGDADPDQQLQTVLGAVRDLLSKGFEQIHVLARVGWDIPDWPPPEDLLWLESRFTDAISPYPVVLFCAYDLTWMPGDALIYGGIETHPFIYLGGQLSANPQWVETETYVNSRLSRLPWLTGNDG